MQTVLSMVLVIFLAIVSFILVLGISMLVIADAFIDAIKEPEKEKGG